MDPELLDVAAARAALRAAVDAAQTAAAQLDFALDALRAAELRETREAKAAARRAG